jgi:hypothetical protein
MIQTLLLSTLLAVLFPAVSSQPAGGAEHHRGSDQPEGRTRLVFSMDQGFGNGLVVNRDLQAAQRMSRAVKSLRPDYDVYFVLNPQLADKAALEAVLDMLASEDVPFVLDVYTSDSQTLGTSTAHNAPADGLHGISISLDQLAALKRKYGRHLAGLRFMEVFSMDFINRAVKTTNPEWNTAGWKVPEDSFFQADLARPFLQFAKEHRMFVQWSDWHWSRFAPWDAPLKAHEAAMRGLLGEFAETVFVTYANNEPEEKSIPRLGNWHEAVEPFLAAGAAGIGLSDQAWMRDPEMSCPIEDLIAWARQARRLGCTYLQFEPAWYFFKLPRGTFGRVDYRKDPKWQDSGAALETFVQLKRALKTRP